MKRWTFRISLCLLLGVVTTVGVAWGSALWSDYSKIEIQACSASPIGAINSESTVETRWFMSGPSMVRFIWGDVRWKRIHPWEDFEIRDGAAYSETPPFRWCFRDTPPTSGVHISEARGWPALALATGMDRRGLEGSGPIERVYRGILLNGSDWNVGHYAEPWVRRIILPLRPILPGFIINALLYGAIWFGIFFAVGFTRRAIRRKCGRCPNCNYDIRHLPEPRCPECGEAFGIPRKRWRAWPGEENHHLPP